MNLNLLAQWLFFAETIQQPKRRCSRGSTRSTDLSDFYICVTFDINFESYSAGLFTLFSLKEQ